MDTEYIYNNTLCFIFCFQSGVKGFARSMPTSAAVDRVAKKKGNYSNKHNIKQLALE